MNAPDSNLRGSVSMALMAIHDDSENAAGEIWHRYFPRLVRVAGATLRRLPHRHHDADDAAQSAFISFWRSVQRGGVTEMMDRNSLWRLLTTITVRKARRIVRDEFAAKRGGGNVQKFSDVEAAMTSGSINDLLKEVPTQDFDLNCQEALEALPDEVREFAVLRLFGHTNVEISEILNCSLRRVERKLSRIRELWSEASMPAEGE